MKNGLLKFFLFFFIAVCLYSTSFGKANCSFADLQLAAGNDSVTIIGKFISPCHIPENVKIWQFDIMNPDNAGKDITVSNSGEFMYHIAIDGPHQVCLNVGKIHFDFMATPKEKIYTLEITCNDAKHEKIEVKNSYENQAFSKLYALNNVLKGSLEKLSKFNMANKDTFAIIRKLFLDYHDSVATIEQSYPESYTAQFLCPSEILPEASLSSIGALRENYLQRDVLSNPQFYNTDFLPFHVCVNYGFLLDKNSPAFTPFNNALNIACKNPQSGKFIERIFYDLFYNQNNDQLMVNYIKWAKLHADSMFNPAVKMQLNNLANCIAGVSFINFQLNDLNGTAKQLSETVASGKLTLLIFYSPTCSHCEKELPMLEPVWVNYKSKGLRIYTVAMDATTDELNHFIGNTVKSEWVNVMEQANENSPSIKYCVNYTPTYVLINQQGKIISRLANFNYLIKKFRNC